MNRQKTYLCIDLKSFYASVECRKRGLDPLNANLVVADPSRTEKTICLAVSPALKSFGVPGRPRLFEVLSRLREVNAERLLKVPDRAFSGSSVYRDELLQNPQLEVSFLTAPPQMAEYMKYSTKIYQIYLQFASPDDIHVYSIDEVFVDLTDYLASSGLSAREYAGQMIRAVLSATGITATAGIGTNLYLAKTAMDIVAKHIPPDKEGVRIAELDEMSYRKLLWNHRPLTDFWRVGRGWAAKLERENIFTMGDIARCSVGKPHDYYSQDLLYRLLGVNAELLIDHAWGYEPCTIADIKAYRPAESSFVSGQVLKYPYEAEKARLVVHEMADELALSLVEKQLVTAQLELTVGYDIENLKDPDRCARYHGEIQTDRYGRKIPKHGHGTEHLERYTSSSRLLSEAALRLFDRITDESLLIRRLSLTVCRVIPESEIPPEEPQQLSMFTDAEAAEEKRKQEDAALLREKKMQQAMLSIKQKYGKNAILKGMNLEEGATARDRNGQIGGHKA